MHSDYSGLHKSEWGYLAATILGLILLISFIVPEKVGNRSKLSLFTATAFAIAIEVWLFSDNFWYALNWYLPLCLIVITTATYIAPQNPSLRIHRLQQLALMLGFSALVSWITVNFIFEISTSQEIWKNNYQISGYLSENIRIKIVSFIQPLYFAIAAFMATAILIAFSALLISLSKFKSVRFDNYGVFTQVIVSLVLPLYFFLWPAVSLGANKDLSQNIISEQITVYIIGLVLVSTLALKRPKTGVDMLAHSTLLLSAVYSLTPFHSSILGNIEYTLYWVFIISSCIFLQLTDNSTRCFTKTTNLNYFGRALLYFAVLFSALSATVHETAPDFSNMLTSIASFRVEIRNIYREIFFVSLFLSFLSALFLGVGLLQKRHHSEFSAQ